MTAFFVIVSAVNYCIGVAKITFLILILSGIGK